MKTLLVVCAAALALIGSAQADTLDGNAQRLYSNEEVEKGIDIGASYLNKKVPFMIDKDTRFDRVTKDGPNKITHHYTIVTAPADKYRTADAKEFLTHWLVRRTCGTPGQRRLVDSGMIVNYELSGNDGLHAVTVTVDRQTCKPI